MICYRKSKPNFLMLLFDGEGTYIHTYIHTCIHAYVHTVHTYIHIYIYIHTYIRVYIHTYINAYIHIYIHTYIHAYIHTVYTYIHIYMSTCTHIPSISRYNCPSLYGTQYALFVPPTTVIQTNAQKVRKLMLLGASVLQLLRFRLDRAGKRPGLPASLKGFSRYEMWTHLCPYLH